jgi:putative tryptophan/tyrosine transport system substrate-binding protein
MTRRDVILGLAGLASLSVLPLGSLGAQQPGRLPKLAFLLPDTPDYAERPSVLKDVLAALADLGYVDGKNVLYEFRFAEHALERLPALAAELVTTRPDVLWTFTSGGARAAAAATSTVPIVIAPVNEGTLASLVTDFARPPGNITGLTLNSREQHEKCLQLLKEAAPSVTRVGVLINPLNPVWRDYPDVLNDAARALGIELVRAEARGAPEVDQAFADMAAQRVEGVFGLSDSTLIGASPTPRRILELLMSARLPSISDDEDFAHEGGLLSLGSDAQARNRATAEYIHRILQGAKVAELPVVRPSNFILAVNLRTAQQLGVTIPPAILLRADEVIE